MKYDAGAGAYDRSTGRWTRLYAPAALRAARVESAARVLDVAVGTGDTAFLASASLPPSGLVAGVDISLPMLRIAAAKCESAAAAFAGASAMALPFADRTFDAAVCQFGLMFFPDRVAALKEIRRTLMPGARLAVTTWGPPERVPYVGLLAQALALALPAQREVVLEPFALADPDVVTGLLRAAGFRDVTIRRELRTAQFESVDDFFDPFEQGGGRIGQIFLQLAPTERAAIRARLTKDLGLKSVVAPFALQLVAHLACGVA